MTDNNLPEEYFWKWRDYQVHIDHYQPNGVKRDKKLILLHGGGGNGRLLSPVAVCFSQLGYECVAPDLPGFGLTKINTPNSYHTWIELVDDLVQKEMNDQQSIILCGVSLGGMLAYQVACVNSNVKGLVVTSLADTRLKDVRAGLARNRIFGSFSSIVFNGLKRSLDNVKIPIRWTTKMWAMANDRNLVTALKRDSVGSGSSVYLKFIRTLFEVAPAIEPFDFDRCPLLFLQPEKDKIIPWVLSKPFYDQLNCEKEVMFLTNCGHIPIEKPGTDQMKESALLFLERI